MEEPQPGVQARMLLADSHRPEATGTDMSGAQPGRELALQVAQGVRGQGGGGVQRETDLGDGGSGARIAELERFCGKLALENEILKKASRTVMSRNGTH